MPNPGAGEDGERAAAPTLKFVDPPQTTFTNPYKPQKPPPRRPKDFSRAGLPTAAPPPRRRGGSAPGETQAAAAAHQRPESARCRPTSSDGAGFDGRVARARGAGVDAPVPLDARGGGEIAKPRRRAR